MWIFLPVLYITTQFTCQITQDIELGSSELSYTITSKREKNRTKEEKNPLTMCKGRGEVCIKQHLDNFAQ